MYNITWWYLFQEYPLREFSDPDSENVLRFMPKILVNEFKITLDFNNLDSDLLEIKNHYNKNDGSCF